MGSMHTNLEEQPDGFERLAEFYRLRAEGGVGLIITGGVSPNESGNLAPNRVIFNHESQIADHQKITTALQPYPTKICMQILHAGRYAYTSQAVAPSALQAPINMYTPKALTEEEIEQQIEDFVNCSLLASKAGYHGVEIMGSEGYLINQFICEETNLREDKWGGTEENRFRFPLEILRRIRAKVAKEFILIFRLSLLDLVAKGSSFEQVLRLAKQLEQCGADIINTGIGWHEARIPTIASMVPTASFANLPARLKPHVSIPIVACNRINSPETANDIIKNAQADLVSMARPFLADSHFVKKAQQDRANFITPCIGCNQACLDNIFVNKVASCVVNPLACNETRYKLTPTNRQKNIAVVGAGVAGCMFALYASQNGHHVTLYEKSGQIGGQFNLAALIPGKEVFNSFIHYLTHQIAESDINLMLNAKVCPKTLNTFDEVVIASGVKPFIPDINNIHHPKVISYDEFIQHPCPRVKDIVIIGSGGIGFDVANKIIAEQQHDLDTPSGFAKHWGVDLNNDTPGGIVTPQPMNTPINITMLQRKARKPGAGLGPTSVWIHREEFKRYGVKHILGVEYEKIDEFGIHIKTRRGSKHLPADVIVLCAGQEENTGASLAEIDVPVHIIGGAKKAKGIDAQNAIEEALTLAIEI